MIRQLNLFTNNILSVGDAQDLTIQSMNEYAQRYDHWVFAWSGGKDSTALLTLIISLIESGQIIKPKTINVLFADTRMELLPLTFSAQSIIKQLKKKEIDVKIVWPELDKRFFVYILGRGVPPPNNNTLRWCTRQIKIDPMSSEIKKLRDKYCSKLLVLTGVRMGESAIRDGRIALSCSKNGAECGQGWFQETLPQSICDTLAPLLHWRVCNIWDWLKILAPKYGWNTQILADAYGGDDALDINARTGCIGCPLAQKDIALDYVINHIPESWGYLAPLLKLKPIYRELRKSKHRLRMPGGQIKKDGTLQKNQNRMGPLKLTSRKWALNEIISIQNEVNEFALKNKFPLIDILNRDEIGRIKELISLRIFPNGWNGDEPSADELFVSHFNDNLIMEPIKFKKL